ncbi:MAG: adenylosuccinate lyase [Candidatus Nealsonbacteria bacterium CG09_land_8_20_14_0_10_42_14]|uniref:Adenylosuccinate lyase n=1 Tax=Candidatus Nealsonbacteria bacterium CG09_land_8_20_14_0_10_42_14 TaxID=1974707 RepID=A0A2H0WZ23_9BACT|nr:MAG: adenylosuccinate lyase [Candidatus Nealsonbacteria bacterium CG09_land_8_20_14_0_10_42_14]
MFEFEKYILPEMAAVWERQNRYEKWLAVEIAVLEAKEELGLIPAGIAQKTKDNARFSIAEIDERDKKIDQEMVSFLRTVESYLPDEVLPYWHGGLTSFDIWDTGRPLQMKEATRLIENEIMELLEVLKSIARIHKVTLEIGRTHGVHAEPITFGLKILNWIGELERHLKRLRENESGFFVGKISGAVGTYSNIDPRIEEIVCRKLGISPAKISNQIVGRDTHYDWLTHLASIDNSLERFATNIRLLQQTEIAEVQEPFKEGGGSSAMPHKRNPNVSERVCSLARITRAFTIVVGENQALQWGEKSLDESAAERVIFSLTCLFLHYNLRIFTGVMEGLKIYTDRMLKNLVLTKGVIFSEDVMLALANKGMSRDKARSLVQRIAQQAWDERKDFKNALKNDPEVKQLLSVVEIKSCLRPENHLKNIDQIFARFGI